MSPANEQRDQRETEEKAKNDAPASQKSGKGTGRRQKSKQRGSDDGRPAQANGESALESRPFEYGEIFDPSAAIRVERLRLARRWRDAGQVYSAIYAYTQVLERYPGSGAASAATEELLDLAKSLADNNLYYTALNIFNRLEELE